MKKGKQKSGIFLKYYNIKSYILYNNSNEDSSKYVILIGHHFTFVLEKKSKFNFYIPIELDIFEDFN